MKIIVAIKQVPDRDAQVRIGPPGPNAGSMKSGLQYAMNEPDAYALEEALQLKEKHGGEVIVVCAGPERVALPFAKHWPRAQTAPSMWSATTSESATLWA